MPNDVKRGEAFAALVQEILDDPQNDWELKSVAADAGMKYATFYARVGANFRVAFSAEEIRQLIRSMPHPRLVHHILDGTPFVAIERATASGTGDGSVIGTMIQTMSEIGDVAHELQHALKDGRVDHRDRAKIREEVNQAEQALAELRAALDAGARR